MLPASQGITHTECYRRVYDILQIYFVEHTRYESLSDVSLSRVS